MTVRSAIAAVLLVGMAGAWWWVLSGSAFRPSAGGPAALPPAARGGLDAPRVHWEQLDVRAVPVRVVRRNPFGGRHAPRAVAVPAAVQPEEVVTPATASDWPRVSLIGISSRTTPGGVERIAVFAGERDVLHAGVADVVAGVYRVERITDDEVDLVRLSDNGPLTLQLR